MPPGFGGEFRAAPRPQDRPRVETKPVALQPHSNASLKQDIDSELNSLRIASILGAERKPRNEYTSTRSINTDVQEHFDNHEIGFLGSGADHVVFQSSEFPDKVVKVHANMLWDLIRVNKQEGLPPDHTSESQWKYLKKFARKERLRHAQLVEYFGEAVPHEQLLRRQVPVTKSLLLAAKRDQAAESLKYHVVYKLWTAVRIQDRLPDLAFDGQDSMSMNTTYTESKHKYQAGEYEALNQQLLDGEGDDAEQIARDYLSRYPQIAHLLRTMEQDPKLKTVVSDFVRKAVRYTKDTGEILDVAGRSNVRAYKDGDEWRLIMPDPLFHYANVWRDTESILWMADRGQELQSKDLGTLINTFNYARFINALAAVTGVDARLSFAYRTAEVSGRILTALAEADPMFALNAQYNVKPRQRNDEATLNRTYAA